MQFITDTSVYNEYIRVFYHLKDIFFIRQIKSEEIMDIIYALNKTGVLQVIRVRRCSSSYQ